jgi:bilirubin oxidase
MDTINDTVCLGATERWQVFNSSGGAHPFHMHDIHFFITKIKTINVFGDTTNVHVPLYMRGPKDVIPATGDTTAVTPPNLHLKTMHEFITTFETFGTPLATDSLADYSYMYHCHILGHEDGGMMHQFVVVSDCGVVSTTPGLSSMDWKLFPNPSNGLLRMQGPVSASGTSLTLLDSKGQAVREWQLAAFSGELSLDLGNLPSGVFLMKWSRPEGVSTKRISVIR